MAENNLEQLWAEEAEQAKAAQEATEAEGAVKSASQADDAGATEESEKTGCFPFHCKTWLAFLFGLCQSLISLRCCLN